MTTDKWISVKDRLPDVIAGIFIACFKNKAVMEVRFQRHIRPNSPHWYKDGFGEENPNNPVTHWMPLPEPPKNKKQ